MTEKLIRDGVPALAARSGCALAVRRAEEYERGVLAAQKLVEESKEFASSPSLEELSDVVEAVYLSLRAHGWSEGDLHAARTRKLASHGGFEQWLVLGAKPIESKGDRA